MRIDQGRGKLAVAEGFLDLEEIDAGFNSVHDSIRAIGDSQGETAYKNMILT